MVVAIFSVHIGNGLFLANNGYEFGLALLAATVSLTVSGAGKFAVDNLFANRIK
jgi:putative oxidoreductase